MQCDQDMGRQVGTETSRKSRKLTAFNLDKMWSQICPVFLEQKKEKRIQIRFWYMFSFLLQTFFVLIIFSCYKTLLSPIPLYPGFFIVSLPCSIINICWLVCILPWTLGIVLLPPYSVSSMLQSMTQVCSLQSIMNEFLH